MPLHFSSKDFDILDLDPPNNPTSHYGACHFGYNLALNNQKIRHNVNQIQKDKVKMHFWLRGGTMGGHINMTLSSSAF